jgi:hypothetical protein
MFEELALLAPTFVPDDPLGVIRAHDGAAKLLDHSALVVERRLEMLNVFLVSNRAYDESDGRAMNSVIDMSSWSHRELILGIPIRNEIDLDFLPKRKETSEQPFVDNFSTLTVHLKHTFSTKKETKSYMFTTRLL